MLNNSFVFLIKKTTKQKKNKNNPEETPSSAGYGMMIKYLAMISANPNNIQSVPICNEYVMGKKKYKIQTTNDESAKKVDNNIIYFLVRV